MNKSTCFRCGKEVVGRGARPRTYCSLACKGAAQSDAQRVTSDEWLREKYIDERLSCVDIGRLVGRDPKSVLLWLRRAGIPTRPRGTAVPSNWFKAGEPSRFKGRSHSPENRERLRQLRLADGHVPYLKDGKPYWQGKFGADHVAWKGGHTPERQAFYSSPEWKAACKTVWARANARCERCALDHRTLSREQRGSFHVHHQAAFSESKKLRADVDNLVLLCGNCHRFVHSKRNTDKEYLHMLGDINVLAQKIGHSFAMYNADCVEVLRAMPTESVHASVFSPPYMALYVYNASNRDLANCRSDAEFWNHFRFVIPELLRLTKPGRIVAVDCMNVPAMKERDGYIGLKDFRGDIIREFVAAGFIFHSEHCLWKDPLLEATRTKALGLMHKQLCKDSAMSRAGLPQYLLAFRKPGTNPEPIAHENGLEEFHGNDAPTAGNLSHERWRRYASPVWDDIDFTETLNERAAREQEDERHVCPMALGITRRALHLWSNPGDVVLSPFAGIGSEGVVAIEMGRKFIGVELKPSYFTQAVKNLIAAEPKARGRQLTIDQLGQVQT